MKAEPDILPLESLGKREDAQRRREGYRTYQGWLAKDRQVVFGQKARAFDSHSQALFHLEQTTIPDSWPQDGHWDADDWEDDPFRDPWLFT